VDAGGTLGDAIDLEGGPNVESRHTVINAERFRSGMTFEQYVKYVGTPENLKREGSMGVARQNYSDFLQKRYEKVRLADAQIGAIRWLTSQADGPAKIVVISEEWSSDCRRDVPTLQRLAEAGGIEMRIFTRDGVKYSGTNRPSSSESPNADLMAEFLNEKNGNVWQSIPVAVFYTKDFRYLHHYTEYPAIYHKDRVVGHLRAPKPGETPEQTKERGTRDFFALQASPFFDVWACAGIDEILSALHERLVVGSL
jgi:thioredoxin family protein